VSLGTKLLAEAVDKQDYAEYRLSKNMTTGIFSKMLVKIFNLI
jgi:hypothetical protein